MGDWPDWGQWPGEGPWEVGWLVPPLIGVMGAIRSRAGWGQGLQEFGQQAPAPIRVGGAIRGRAGWREGLWANCGRLASYPTP